MNKPRSLSGIRSTTINKFLELIISLLILIKKAFNNILITFKSQLQINVLFQSNYLFPYIFGVDIKYNFLLFLWICQFE